MIFVVFFGEAWVGGEVFLVEFGGFVHEVEGSMDWNPVQVTGNARWSVVAGEMG